MVLSRFFSLLILFFLCIQLIGQDLGKIGDWRSFLPYNSGRLVTQSETKVIYATEWALIIVDKEDLSYEFVSKVDGLSDIGIQQIHFDKTTESLVIAYTNSNIDVYTNDGVFNFSEILNNTSISGDKLIYSINSDKGKCYFSTGFGLVELDLRSYDFGFTCFTGLRVNQSIVIKDKIIISTAEGLYQIDQNNNLNPGDFNNWDFIAQDLGLPSIYAASYMTEQDDKLYVCVDNKLMSSDLTSDFNSIFELSSDQSFWSLSSDFSKILLGYRIGNASGQMVFFENDQEIGRNKSNCIWQIIGAIEDQNGGIWYAEQSNELRYSPTYDVDCDRIVFNTPYTNLVSDIAVDNGSLYVSGGGVSENFTYLYTGSGFYFFEDNNWNNFQKSKIDFLDTNDLFNFFRIVPHPTQNKLYAGSYWGGLVAYDKDTEEFSLFDDQNSSLQGATGDSQRERISGLVFDEDENLWVTNFLAARPLSVKTPEGDWQSFSVGNKTNLANIVIDDFENKWIRVQGEGGGVMVYNHGEDVLDRNDDSSLFLNSSNTELTSNTINDLDIDKSGQVWVGTTEGPVIFDCGPDVIDGECTGRRIKVLQDSIAAFLLADVEIRTIEIDGANRKWFGTRNGIFVQDASGEEQVLRFTAANSPLFDDNIIDLAYDGMTGQMYIASDRGIQLYKTETLDGGRFHESKVLVYPNPVRPDYSGPIAIKGLPDSANVKITDIDGNVVFETESLGSQAIWDGNNLNGQPVQSGIYLVFSSTTDTFNDTDTFVSKFMVIR